MRKLCIPVLVAVLVGLAATLTIGAGSAAARPKTPCWQLLLNDEYDNHIDGVYSVGCYKAAIAHLPEDSLIYGQLKQDLTQAMLSATAAQKKKGAKVTNSTPVPPEEDSRGLQSEHKHKKGFIAVIADKIGPGNASSIPLPLLILAGLGLLLIAAAGASFTARWLAARRSPPTPATAPPTPPGPPRK
jgi:hypothetical protein